MNPDKIKAEFIRIRDLGYLKNVKSDNNDGAAGNTFESHLGVIENNLREADYDGFEIKTKKWLANRSSTPYTLFSLRPSYPDSGDNHMRNNWGVPDKRYPNVKRFSTTLWGNRWSTVYKANLLKLEVDRNSKKVFVVYADLNKTVLDRTVYFTFDDIEEGATKLKNMFLVNANVQSNNGKHCFHYTDATILFDYRGHENFIKLIEDGCIRYDNRLGVYGPTTSQAGRPHNHGGGFRISKTDIVKLFNKKLEIN